MKKKLIYILLGLSLLLNALYFKYDTVDYLWPKIEKKYFEPNLLVTNDYNKAEEKIIESSLKMLKGFGRNFQEVVMSLMLPLQRCSYMDKH